MHYKMRKDGNLNDVILILQMKQGDEQAFDKFVRKYYGDILSYCKYHCLDQTEAEDLTQETFLRFMNNIQSYQHIGKAKNYLYVIAGNLCKNHVKKWKADCVEKEVLGKMVDRDSGNARHCVGNLCGSYNRYLGIWCIYLPADCDFRIGLWYANRDVGTE